MTDSRPRPRPARGRAFHRDAWIAATLLLVSLVPASAHALDMAAVLDAACKGEGAVDRVLAAAGGGIHLQRRDLDAPPGVTAQRDLHLLPSGDRIRVDIHRREARMAQVIVEHRQRVEGDLRPKLWAVTDGRCRLRAARRLIYGASGSPRRMDDLAADLRRVRVSHELDAPVPAGPVEPGVVVAMVDSGINYQLPGIAARLARRADGALLGYDYWDLDPRPFDSHPSRSAFHPTRHGTRTTSVLLADAPVARVAPMRYPRPDMTRMRDLVADAAAAGIGIVNLSLGGRSREDWVAFEAAARAHPGILFIASAGNNGQDLDVNPVYPAALSLDNLITVTSADDNGLPARGSNWGRRSVHLMVPAEAMVATGFDGYARRVSGSSYAAARVSALAACLKAANPSWGAAELRGAIFDMAVASVHQSVAYVAVGLLPEPTVRRRGACEAEPASPSRIARMVLDPPAVASTVPATHRMAALSLVWIENAGWPIAAIEPAVQTVARIFAQCGVRLGPVSVSLWRVPRDQRIFDTRNALRLVGELDVPAPSVWFMRDSLNEPAFDAEAIGRSNSRGRRALMNSVWLTSHLEHPGIALAHELYHVLANTGAHVPESDNLMNANATAETTRLGDWQCQRLIKVGSAFGLVEAL